MEKNTLIWAVYCRICKRSLPIRGMWEETIVCPGCKTTLGAPSASEYLLVHCTACRKWNMVKQSQIASFICPCNQLPPVNLNTNSISQNITPSPAQIHKNEQRENQKSQIGEKARTAGKEQIVGQSVQSGQSQFSEPQNLVLDRYELVEMLGTGLAGQVWKAVDKSQNGHVVAIKFVKEGEGSQILRAEREAQVLAQINHPGVIHVDGYFRGVGFPIVENDHLIKFSFLQDNACIIMEYIGGGDLSKWIEGKRFMPQDIARLFIPIYDALQTIHDIGVVHRDLKLANILLKNGQPVITDFGLSRLVDETSITARGTIMGSLDYMAPEQALGKTADARSDIYATGAMMWYILFGKPVFSACSPLVQIRRIVRDPISHDIEALPSTFQYILKKLLAKKQEMRFQTAREAKNALEYFLEEAASHPALEPASVPVQKAAKKPDSLFVAPPIPDIEGTTTKTTELVRKSFQRNTKRLRTVHEKRFLRNYFHRLVQKWGWPFLFVFFIFLILLVLFQIFH